MRTPLDIAFSIWMRAVAAFTLLTVIVIWKVGDFWAGLGFLLIGALVSALCSFPVFTVLLLLLKKCQASGLSGAWTLLLVYAVGITSAIIVYYVFLWMFAFIELENSLLFVFIVASGAVGITMQARSIIKISAVEPE